jgi:Fibronectin type III domain
LRTPRRRELTRGLLAAIVLGLAVALAAPAASIAQRPRPANLQLTPAPASLSASWDVSSTTGLTGFHIRWKQAGGGGGGHVDVARGVRSYTISRLRHVGYEVRVRALYHGRIGPFVSAEATPLPGGEEPPEEEEPPVEEEPVEEEPPVEEEEPVEEEPVEEPQEEGPQGALVSATPTGPPTPAGGWSVVYADGFGAPIGKGPGQDNTWFPNNCTLTSNCHGFNSDELEVFNPSAAKVTPEGLKLTCTYTVAAQEPGGKHYVCGALRGQNQGMPGYRFFTWSPGKGQTLVFQAVAKLPPNTGEADPGWWSAGPPWNDTEIDFFEGGGASGSHSTGWRTDPIYTAWFATPHVTANKPGFTVDPSLAFHTYTFEVKPDNTYSIWIDGVPQSWATNVGPVKPDLAAKTTLVLSYALRECRCVTGFTSGTREFDVKSVSVYEDKAHRGVGIENEGVAPGTSIG